MKATDQMQSDRDEQGVLQVLVATKLVASAVDAAKAAGLGQESNASTIGRIQRSIDAAVANWKASTLGPDVDADLIYIHATLSSHVAISLRLSQEIRDMLEGKGHVRVATPNQDGPVTIH